MNPIQYFLRFREADSGKRLSDFLRQNVSNDTLRSKNRQALVEYGSQTEVSVG